MVAPLSRDEQHLVQFIGRLEKIVLQREDLPETFPRERVLEELENLRQSLDGYIGWAFAEIVGLRLPEVLEIFGESQTDIGFRLAPVVLTELIGKLSEGKISPRRQSFLSELQTHAQCIAGFESFGECRAVYHDDLLAALAKTLAPGVMSCMIADSDEKPTAPCLQLIFFALISGRPFEEVRAAYLQPAAEWVVENMFKREPKQ